MRDVVAAIDHRPVDEVLAVLDEDLLQELRIRDVDDRHRASVPAQYLAPLTNRLGYLKQALTLGTGGQSILVMIR